MFVKQPKRFAWPFCSRRCPPVVKDFIKKVRERAVGHEVIDTPIQRNRLSRLSWTKNWQLSWALILLRLSSRSKIPTIIMWWLVCKGCGKTTLAGKLANKLKKEENASSAHDCGGYLPSSGQIDQLKHDSKFDVPVCRYGSSSCWD